MNTTILLKTNKALKTEAKQIAEGMGLSLTAVMNAQLKQFVRDRKISLESTFKLNPIAEKRIKNALKDYAGRKNLVAHASVEDFLAHIGKQS